MPLFRRRLFRRLSFRFAAAELSPFDAAFLLLDAAAFDAFAF